MLQIFDDFGKVSADTELLAFVKKYSLMKTEASVNTQILGIYRGVCDGATVQVTHRWYDPSGPFSIQPDIHKAKLEVDGYPARELSYEG